MDSNLLAKESNSGGESWFAWVSPSWKGWDIPPAKVIRSFNIIKAMFIFLLVPYHITVVARLVPSVPSYASFYLPYPTTYHGLEFMMGLLFISGWLSHATTKPGITFSELMKKKLLRLLPAYYIGGIVFTWVCIVWEASTGNLHGPSGGLGVGIQFALELLTLGSWNPALLFWTRNRPLWFISTLLCYYYFLPIYLPWVRGLKSTKIVFSVMIGMVVVRMLLGLTIYYTLTFIFPHTYEHYPRIAHLWSVTQIFQPFIGCTLCEFSNRIGRLKWHRNTIWRVTDFVTIFTVCMAMFVMSPPLWGSQFDIETGKFVNESKGEYIFGSLCAFSQFLVWPMMLMAVYLYSHDQSTLTWIYTCYPSFFEAGVAASFPLFLTHWPILLIIQKTKTFDTTSGVSVIMLFCVCLSTSLVYDNFVISPLEERIVTYFNAPVKKPSATATAAAADGKSVASGQKGGGDVTKSGATTSTSMVIKAELQQKLALQLEDAKLKDEFIRALELKVTELEGVVDQLKRDQILRSSQSNRQRRSSFVARPSGYRMSAHIASHNIRPSWDLDADEMFGVLLGIDEEEGDGRDEEDGL